MKFDVYCDESRPDLFGSTKPTAQHLVIGSLWIPSQNREKFKQQLHNLRDQFKIGGEFKWQKVSPSRVDFYKELITWFVSLGELVRFRCIAVDRNQVNLQLYHDGDQELGFYKFYYQLLHHWILDCNEYTVFVDFKLNRKRDRLAVLCRCLDYANLSSQVRTVQAIRSEESVLIQMADVLTGAASYRLNNQIREGSAKYAVLDHLEKSLGKSIAHTPKGEQKFNVFKIHLSGGW
ncbi:MAG: DUF3800 domain-containing protein [Phycisphaerales bacterium]|nr:MAG: DUF3800 domain-containing protein [Phycisphaerales bacterium]